MTLSILAPLCTLETLSALAPISTAGILGLIFTAIVMGIRFWDGTYRYSDEAMLKFSQAGVYLSKLQPSLRPSFNVIRRNSNDLSHLWSPASFVLLSMLNTAYMCHYLAPRVYNELNENTKPKFHKIVRLAFGFSAVLLAFMLSTGYLTFGGNADSFILNNYANTDMLATAARGAVGIALLSGYPILFTGLKDGIIDLFGLKTISKVYRKSNTAISLLILLFLNIIAMKIADISFLVSFSGALCGSLLMFIFPALMDITMGRSNQKKMYLQLLELEYGFPYWERVTSYPHILRDLDKTKKKLFKLRLRKALSYLILSGGIGMAVVGLIACFLKELE